MPLSEWFSIFANLATILGIPIALLLYAEEKRKERRDREYGTYDALDEKWNEFLKMCIEYPEFDMYDFSMDHPDIELTPEQRVRQYAMFDILVSLLERAYLMYHDQSSKLKRKQWTGWNSDFIDYSQAKSFRRLWVIRGTNYDEEFTAYMNILVNNAIKAEGHE